MSYTVKNSIQNSLICVRKHAFTAKKCYAGVHIWQIIV